ncbi:MAG TPA: RNA 2',3'-cyclic phosphodiesterase [Opitutaceae bacterium]|nr:RNA 2',3'-cyclic phosphodiesterase [Opitutaceae bacterium]
MTPEPEATAKDTERMFIALTLPDAVRETLLMLRTRLGGITWTSPEQWHVTLRFLGDVARARTQLLIDRLAAIRVEPFILPVEGVGTFPPNRPPRVAWVGTGSGHPRLFQLRQRIDDAILACGLDVDLRTFHPHVTIARCTGQGAAAIARWAHAHREFAAPPFRVDAFDLYASDLRPSGAVHTLRQRFLLAAP